MRKIKNKNIQIFYFSLIFETKRDNSYFYPLFIEKKMLTYDK